MREALESILGGRDLGAARMREAFGEILEGRATAAQIAAFAVALRMKGESEEELAAAAEEMRARCVRVRSPAPVVLDTCGTGGDGAGTFNVSTAAAFVVAASGVVVAKHGNRAVSSKAGSADVLEALGVRVDLQPADQEALLCEIGIAFLFAPAHHPALRHAAAARKELGVRTFFNLLGPLASPAFATHQLLGLYDPARLAQIARVLGRLGTRRAMVVHGGGLDEVAPSGPTRVAELDGGSVRETELSPRDFGIAEHPIGEIAGGDASTNARIIEDVLAGQPGPHRDMTILNAAAALMAAEVTQEPREAARRAAEAIDSGAATAKLAALRAFAAR
ncbi:MAG: anthranilate phosphoribosyltransferase [Deltaproteobacteria bacterium]|nr:anthranilate phosphoribosyltransferase [Deltaproteobacteria bacterium]